MRRAEGWSTDNGRQSGLDLACGNQEKHGHEGHSREEDDSDVLHGIVLRRKNCNRKAGYVLSILANQGS